MNVMNIVPVSAPSAEQRLARMTAWPRSMRSHHIQRIMDRALSEARQICRQQVQNPVTLEAQVDDHVRGWRVSIRGADEIRPAVAVHTLPVLSFVLVDRLCPDPGGRDQGQELGPVHDNEVLMDELYELVFDYLVATHMLTRLPKDRLGLDGTLTQVEVAENLGPAYSTAFSIGRLSCIPVPKPTAPSLATVIELIFAALIAEMHQDLAGARTFPQMKGLWSDWIHGQS